MAFFYLTKSIYIYIYNDHVKRIQSMDIKISLKDFKISEKREFVARVLCVQYSCNDKISGILVTVKQNNNECKQYSVLFS